MTVRYSNAQLQQQRDLPGAGVRREAVSLSQLTWMQKFIARDTNLNAGETGPVISGDFGPRDPIAWDVIVHRFGFWRPIVDRGDHTQIKSGMRPVCHNTLC